MSTLVEKRNIAGDRYRESVIEFKDAFCQLSALDQLCQAPSFGPPPATIPLRHPTYLPDLAGSVTDGFTAALNAQLAALTARSS